MTDSQTNQKLLIGLTTQVSGLTVKFDYMAKDMKTLSENMIERIAKNESQLSSLSKLVEDDHQTLRDLKVIWKFVVATSAAIGTVMGFALTLLMNIFHSRP